MLYCVLSLATQGASSRVWQPPLGQAIQSLTSIIDGKPDKELALCNGAQVFQILFHAQK